MKKMTKKKAARTFYREFQLALILTMVFLLLSAFFQLVQNNKKQNISVDQTKNSTISTISEPTVVPTERYSPFLEDKIPMDKEMFIYTVETAEKYGLEPELVFAVMRQESNFDFHAISDDGSCIGIMQVHEINYEDLRNRIFITNLGDPFENIKAGCFILSELLEKYPLERALVCYNCGEYDNEYESTQYSRNVLKYMEEYK